MFFFCRVHINMNKHSCSNYYIRKEVQKQLNPNNMALDFNQNVKQNENYFHKFNNEILAVIDTINQLGKEIINVKTLWKKMNWKSMECFIGFLKRHPEVFFVTIGRIMEVKA